MTAMEAAATAAACHQRRRIALASTNGRYGVNSQPVTVPSVDRRMAVGTATAPRPQRIAIQLRNCGAESNRSKLGRTIGAFLDLYVNVS